MLAGKMGDVDMGMEVENNPPTPAAALVVNSQVTASPSRTIAHTHTQRILMHAFIHLLSAVTSQRVLMCLC